MTEETTMPDPDTNDQPDTELEGGNSEPEQELVSNDVLGKDDAEGEPGAPEEGEEKTPTKHKHKGLLEYALSDMYPELSMLVQKTKCEWNFSDPEIIRAIWLEAKTNALAHWKVKYSTIRKKKEPSIPVQLNHATQLRNEFRQTQKKQEKELLDVQYGIGKDAPEFKEQKLPTTITAQMRYKLNRDNPPVPEFYIHHFAKYRKPPFMSKVTTGRRCKPN